MEKLFLLLLFCHVSSAVKHSLKYFFTGSSGVPNFPEFVGVAVVDEILVAYCDSNKKILEPKQDWMRKMFENDPQHLERYSQGCFEYVPNIFKATIYSLKQRFNQTGGVHLLHSMTGCEWDDETGEFNGFDQFGYNGEDFISFDLKTSTWITPNQKAIFTKQRWDADKARIKRNEIYFTEIYPERLKKYVAVGNSSLLRTDLPSVSLLQKTPSSPVSCHATGFYPDRAMIFWRKDGEELHEDVDLGDILPNHDGSFQMSVDLKLSSVTPEDWRRYDCVFRLYGVQDEIVTRLDEAAIRTNWVPPSGFPAGAVIGLVVGVLLLLLALCITGLFMWRRNNNGFRPANTSDSSSSSVKHSAST